MACKARLEPTNKISGHPTPEFNGHNKNTCNIQIDGSKIIHN